MIDKLLIIGLVLTGSISNSTGRIGILVSNSGVVKKTHLHSPASGLIYPGDIVISANGYKGNKEVDGLPGTVCVIVIKRQKELKTFEIIRVPKEEISD